jgi:hypothetical protein
MSRRLWLRVHLKSWQENPEKSGEKKPKDTWHGAPEPLVEYFLSNRRVILKNVS